MATKKKTTKKKPAKKAAAKKKTQTAKKATQKTAKKKTTKKAELKTRPTAASAAAFLGAVAPESVKNDCVKIAAWMEKAAGAPPVMWGPAIVGFGTTNLVYASGRELEWPRIAFSPRKNTITLYISFTGQDALLAKLGTFSTSKACLYIKKLADVDESVLQQIIAKSLQNTPAA